MTRQFAIWGAHNSCYTAQRLHPWRAEDPRERWRVQISRGGGMLSETCAAARWPRSKTNMGDGPVPSILNGTWGWEETPPARPAQLSSFPTCPVLSPAPQSREDAGMWARGVTGPGSSFCLICDRSYGSPLPLLGTMNLSFFQRQERSRSRITWEGVCAKGYLAPWPPVGWLLGHQTCSSALSSPEQVKREWENGMAGPAGAVVTWGARMCELSVGQVPRSGPCPRGQPAN